MDTRISLNFRHRLIVGMAIRSVALLLGVSALGACTMNAGNSQMEGIGYREARFAEAESMRSYRACRDDALRLDEEARKTSNPGQYLASARLLESCESDLGSGAGSIAAEERMRAYALAVQNHLKGGDVRAARTGLERFRQAFVEQDLYLAGGVSFIDTYEVLLTQVGESAVSVTVANIREPLRDEVRRTRYWKQN